LIQVIPSDVVLLVTLLLVTLLLPWLLVTRL
jgi:hypothetical protein